MPVACPVCILRDSGTYTASEGWNVRKEMWGGRISAGALVMLTMLLFGLPLPWLAAASVAAMVHEAGHYIAILLLGGGGAGIRFYATSAKMCLPQMGRCRELVCTLAGPVFGLVLAALYPWLPRTALCALGQSAFNLLPVYPLDGGRSMHCILQMILPPPKAERVANVIELSVRCAVVCGAIVATFFLNFGVLPLIVAGIMVIPRK